MDTDSEKTIHKEIIRGYRNTIKERYKYEDLANKIELPSSINEEAVKKIRNYFLEYLYPDYSKRQELNVAFESLDSYIKSPEKLLNILMTSMRLIFSHGRHLPKILNTCLKALKSFRAGTKFENRLVEQAIENEIDAPYESDKIEKLIGGLPQSEINEFIVHSKSLIEVFHDQKLVSKIEEILSFLISKMQSNQKLYTHHDINGITLGYEMLKKGNELFNSFEKEDQHFILNMIVELERNHLNEIFEKYGEGSG